jgi:hypothetical protein
MADLADPHGPDNHPDNPDNLDNLTQGDLRLLEHQLARRLLVSKEMARLAYTALDGTPRVVPVMFHWDGDDVVVASFANAHKIAAIHRRPDVALTIDTTVHPPEILLIRGRAEITDVDGVVPEFVLANIRYGGEEFGRSRVAEVDHPGLKMHRIAIRPTWVGVLDFKTRFSRGRGQDEFLLRGRKG